MMGRIKALILSVIHNFPVGAAMYLEYGNESIRFKYRPIEGSSANPDIEPDELILDGQQRLTFLYNALYSKNPIRTKTDKGKEIDRYYYLDIEKAIDSSADDEKVVISIPATKQVTSDFGRKIELVTAIFAMDDFPLRKDWEERKEKYFSGDLLNIVTAMDFLTALTLLASFKAGGDSELQEEGCAGFEAGII